MEKIYILGKDGLYEEAEVIDNAIKEQIKENGHKQRDGIVQADKGEVTELAPDELHRPGKDSVV